MAISSIHISAVKSGSENHNKRAHEMPHVRKELTPKNETWVSEPIKERSNKIKLHCYERSGRHMQKNATPIREAVVNLEAHHTIEDLKKLGENLRKEFGIHCFQIYIHRDEGHQEKDGNFRINHHAHMLFDWQDKVKGTMKRINKLGMVKMQTVVADSLGMQRGKFNSKAERLEAQAYKLTKNIEKMELESKQLDEKIEKKKEVLSSTNSYRTRLEMNLKNLMREKEERNLLLKAKLESLKEQYQSTINDLKTCENQLQQSSIDLRSSENQLHNSKQNLAQLKSFLGQEQSSVKTKVNQVKKELRQGRTM